MALSERIESLKAKHARLEERLTDEKTRPHPDEVALHNIKRQKLQIKDELRSMGVS